jgi:predicted nuclease with TOPRIM domain
VILAELSPTWITAIGGLILSALTGAGAWIAARPKDKATAADTLADTAVKLTELATSQSIASQHQYAADMLEVRQELSQIREENAKLRERMAAMDARAELLRQTNDLYRRELETHGIPIPRLI